MMVMPGPPFPLPLPFPLPFPFGPFPSPADPPLPFPPIPFPGTAEGIIFVAAAAGCVGDGAEATEAAGEGTGTESEGFDEDAGGM
jgi:hypothetical protein